MTTAHSGSLKKIFKILFWFITGIVSLILAISLILLIPSVQLYLTGKAVETVEKQFGIKTKIEGIYIRPPKTVSIDGMYVQDDKKDTLLYVGKLRINTGLFGLFHKNIHIESLYLDNLTAKIDRQANDSSFNFQFIIDAFTGKSSEPQPGENQWKIDANAIELHDISFTMDDDYGGIYLDAKLSSGDIDIDQMNLKNKEIAFNNIKLSGFYGHLDQPDSTDEKNKRNSKAKTAKKDTTGFVFTSGDLELNDIKFSMNHPGSAFYLNSGLEHLHSKNPGISLADLHIDIQDLLAQRVLCEIEINEPPNDSLNLSTSTPDPLTVKRKDKYLFGDFNLEVILGHGRIEDGYYAMEYPSAPGSEALDFRHMELKDINFDLEDVSFDNEGVGGMIHTLAVSDRSGLSLEALSAKVLFDNKQLSLSNLMIKTPDSQVRADAKIDYPSFGSIMSNPGKLNIDISMTATPLDTRDLSYFIPEDSIRTNELFNNHELQLDIKTLGSLGDLSIKRFRVKMDSDTRLQVTGALRGLPDIQSSYADIKLDTFYTTFETIRKFTGQDSLPGNIQPYATLSARASLTGAPDSARFDFRLLTDNGFLIANAAISEADEIYSFNADVSFSDLQAGIITGVDKLGSTSGTLKALISIDTAGLRSANATVNIDSIMYNAYRYRDITSNITVDNSRYKLSSRVGDPDLNFTLDADLLRTGDASHLDVALAIAKADLKALNFMEKDLAVSGNIHTSLDFHDPKDYSGKTVIDSLKLNNGKRIYTINKILYTAEVDSSRNNYEIDSDVLYANLHGNAKLIEIPGLIRDHSMAFTLSDTVAHENERQFDIEVKLYEPEILSAFIIPEITDFSLESFKVHFDERNKLLTANIRIPHLTYSNIHLDTLILDLHSTHERLESKLSLNKFQYDSLTVDSLEWLIQTRDETIYSRFIVGDTLQRKYDLGMQIELRDSTRILSFIPGQLLSGGVAWSVPEDNRLTIGRQEINTHAMQLESEAGRITFQARESEMQIIFENYPTSCITSIFSNPGLNNAFSAKINGEIRANNLFLDPVFDINLQVNEIKSFGADPGDLTIVIKQPADTVIHLDVRLISPDNNLSGTGNIGIGTNNSPIDFKTKWEIKKPEVFQPWMAGYIKKIGGTVTGNLDISGTPGHIVPAGKIQFNKFHVTTADVITQFSLEHEAINLDENGLHLGNIRFLDSLGNSMVLAGDLLTSDYQTFKFDLKLNTNRFLFINNTQKDLETLYGKLMAAADINITGFTGSPVIRCNMDILKETDITYAMTGSDLMLQSDEGIVVYSADEISYDSLIRISTKQSVADSLARKITGLKLDAHLTIDENARFTLVTNPTAGDYANFKMNGELTYHYEPAQLGILHGKIDLIEGEYELSFYGLIHKKFILVPDSYIRWAGTVMDGNIQFQAKYMVKSNSLGLVGSEVSDAEKANYNQRLPYEVILNVDGILSEPHISFNIDLPETYRSGQPLIDSKLESLNQEGMENQRERQALALLVGGTFIPESSGVGDDGSSFATTAAMNSMNSILTRQLNNLSGMLVKDIEVTMGFNKIDNYGGSSSSNNTRTQLDIGVNKYFMENRVLIGVEGHIDLEGSNPVYKNNTGAQTEFIVQYLLTRNGNYRIKAFRENAFDLIDGEIQNTGLAFIFVVDFGKQLSGKGTKKRGKGDNTDDKK